jgi:hypothetical protein
VNGRDRTLRVVGPFGIPAGNDGIKGRVGEDEEHLDVTVKVMVIPLGNKVCKQGPYNRCRVGEGTPGPVLGDGFGAIVQVSTVLQDLFCLFAVVV